MDPRSTFNLPPAPRVLIVKPSSLGDIVHALPVLAALRRQYPRAHIAWLASRAFAPLLEGHPLLDEVITFDRRHYGRMLRSLSALGAFLRFVRRLRSSRFDLVLDLQGLFRSGFLAWATGAPLRFGFADARELAWLFYTGRVPGRRRTHHAVDLNLRLAAALGLPADAPTFPLGLHAEELAAARRLLASAPGRPVEQFTAVIPGARWETKRWRADRLASLLDRLHADGYGPCVLLGAPDDREFSDEILAAAATRPIDLVGRTSLRELAAVLALARLVICHDSGPMHIAAALAKPLVAIFGPTNPARTGPYCQSARIIQLPLECVPCYARRCPLGHHNCMQQLELETVLAAVRDISPASQPPRLAESPA
jgi:heptosyltransferase I